jgi:MFS family permease
MGLLGAGVVLMVLVLTSIWVGWWQPQVGFPWAWAVLAGALVFVALGALILWKADGNRVGWLFAAVGLSMLLSAVTEGLAQLGVIAIAGLSGAFWLSWFILIGLLFLWFPTGQRPGRRWRFAERLAFGVLGVLFVAYSFSERVCIDSSPDGDCVEYTQNPIGIPGMPNPEFEWLFVPLFLSVALFLVLSLVSLVVRFRRSETDERLQLKWFLTAGVSFFAAMLSAAVLGVFGWLAPAWLFAWFVIGFLAIPVSATVAILRYRLYEIDRIISRTVSYALVVGVLGLVFAAGVVGLPRLIGLGESPLLVAGSTLAVAALFNPVRRRVQRWVDRRFNRSRYDAEQVMAEFAGSLQDRVDPDGLIDGWVEVVAETMQPTSVGVWVRES